MGLFESLFSEQSAEDVQFEKQIRTDGVPCASGRIADILNEQISGRRDFAHQFVLEELDAARHGDEQSVRFVRESGIPESEYKGAMQRTSWGEDDLFNRIQMLFRSFTFRIADSDLRTELSLGVVDRIMALYSLGKYAKNENFSDYKLDLLELEIESDQTKDGLFVFLFTGLNAAFSSVPLTSIPESHEKNLFMMSYAYAARTLSAGLFAQGLVGRDFFKESQRKFIEFQKVTDHSIQFQEKAAEVSFDFFQPYDDRITKELVGVLLSVAFDPNSIDNTEYGNQHSYEAIIQILESSCVQNKKFSLDRASTSNDKNLSQFLQKTAFSLISSLGDDLDEFMAYEISQGKILLHDEGYEIYHPYNHPVYVEDDEGVFEGRPDMHHLSAIISRIESQYKEMQTLHSFQAVTQNHKDFTDILKKTAECKMTLIILRARILGMIAQFQLNNS
jgi:hypothetical protein